MLLTLLALIAVALTIATYHFRQTSLAYASLAFWLIAAVSAYTQSTAGWDLYYMVFWACMTMTFITGFLTYGIYSGGKKERSIDESREVDAMEADYPGFRNLDPDIQDALIAQKQLKMFSGNKRLSKPKDDFEPLP